MNTTNPLIILPALLLLAPLQLFTQAPFTDQVLMEDGTRHDGLIVEQKPGEYIRLWRQAVGDTLTLIMDDIDRMLRIAPESTTDPTDRAPDAIPADRDFGSNRFMVLLRGSTGGGDYAFHGAGMAVGLRIGHGLEIGLGAQYFGQYSDNTIPQRQLIPLTLDLRYRLNTSPGGRFASLISLESGLAFSLNKDYFDWGRNRPVSIRNGFYLHPALAFQVYLVPNFGLLLDVGYQFNSGQVVPFEGGGPLTTKRYSNAIVRGSLFF
jgi:hypothetical protein